jgi:shikimate kinase
LDVPNLTEQESPLENKSIMRAMPAAGNIILIGVLGAGKSSVGWHLARLMGLGFLDLDDWIEKKAQKTIAEIFSNDGESAFRNLEEQAISEIIDVRNHVISVGGGAVVDDENWSRLRAIGLTVWLNTPPAEIARRFVMRPGDIAQRPLIQDVASAESKDQRFVMLHDRISNFIKHRQKRFEEADASIVDSYSTPESAAMVVKSKISSQKS